MGKRTNASLPPSLECVKSQINQLSSLLPSCGVTFEVTFLTFATASKQTLMLSPKLPRTMESSIFHGRLLLLLLLLSSELHITFDPAVLCAGWCEWCSSIRTLESAERSDWWSMPPLLWSPRAAAFRSGRRIMIRDTASRRPWNLICLWYVNTILQVDSGIYKVKL